MNTVLQAPGWAETTEENSTVGIALRQLVNAAGPLAMGMATAIQAVQRSEQAEREGQVPYLDASQRSNLIAMCGVAAQILGECANDACDTLIRSGTN